MIYILMVLNLSGPEPAQPVATTAFSDAELCIRQSGAFRERHWHGFVDASDTSKGTVDINGGTK